jgi:large subunit ribosomal protein L36e
MPGQLDSTGLAVGLKKGFLVEKRALKAKPAQRRKQGKHVAFVRGIIREIAGYSPLERRGMELLKNGRDKRVLKLCKKRVRRSHHFFQSIDLEGLDCEQSYCPGSVLTMPPCSRAAGDPQAGEGHPREVPDAPPRGHP